MSTPKSLLLSLGLLLTCVLSLPSCKRVYDEPLLTEPKSGLTPNITISELKQKFSGAKQGASLRIDVDYVLRATVSGNDESGNIYKTLYIQDETGGIPVAVDMSNMSTSYIVGQELLIKLKGLSINVYGGVQQIGYVDEDPEQTRIPSALWESVAERNGYPDYAKVKPIITSLNQLNDSMLGMLVEVRDVAWSEPGQVFAIKEENTNRLITDGTNSLIVRNSGYSTFANDKLPEGIGTVRGILSKFNSDYQLFLRAKDDVLDFRPGTPSGPSNPSTPIVPGGDTPTPDTPAGDAPSTQSTDAVLLFPGADFETEPNVGEFGFKDAAIESGVGRNDSKALHISGTPSGNNYVFSTATFSGDASKSYTKVSFWLKGTASGKSLSVNIYDANGKYWGFNIGDVSGHKVVKNAGSTATTQFVNDYKGVINTGGEWILVTLDITGLSINTTGKGNVIGFKDGSNAPYDLYLDDIKIE